MSQWWCQVVVHLLLFPSLYSHLYFDPHNEFRPHFVIFRRSACCKSEAESLFRYIKSSQIHVTLNVTVMSLCAKVEGPDEGLTINRKGFIYVVLDDLKEEEKKEEQFCYGRGQLTGVGLYRVNREGRQWQGHLIAFQSPLLDVDKAMAVGDWPDRVDDSLELRILLESAILLYQRPLRSDNDTKQEPETRKSYKKGTRIKTPEEGKHMGIPPEQFDGSQKEQSSNHLLWLFSIIPGVLLIIAAVGYYRYKVKRNQLLARKTYIKVVYKADTTTGNVQWHESSQSASEEDKSSSSRKNTTSVSKSGKTKKKSRSVKEFMHEYFERLTTSD